MDRRNKSGNSSMLRRVTGNLGLTPNSLRKIRTTLLVFLITATLLVILAIALSPRLALALPLYARQTGQPCATCHTAFLELTPFGRRFKLGGYTLDGGDWKGPPFAVMLQPTFTNTQGAQPGGAAPGFGVNNDFVMEQMSLFTGGKITENMGAFIQGTYDGVAHTFSWDNTDVRYARSINIDGHDLLWGIDLNNNPTVQDVWNTIPAWSFPYITSELAPFPATSTFIEQVYAGQVLGLSAYGFLDTRSISSSAATGRCRTRHSSRSASVRPARARHQASHPIGGSRPRRTLATIPGRSAHSASPPRSFRWGCRKPEPIRLPISASTRSTNSSAIRTW
jgi:hypothetical protein